MMIEPKNCFRPKPEGDDLLNPGASFTAKIKPYRLPPNTPEDWEVSLNFGENGVELMIHRPGKPYYPWMSGMFVGQVDMRWDLFVASWRDFPGVNDGGDSSCVWDEAREIVAILAAKHNASPVEGGS